MDDTVEDSWADGDRTFHSRAKKLDTVSGVCFFPSVQTALMGVEGPVFDARHERYSSPHQAVGRGKSILQQFFGLSRAV